MEDMTPRNVVSRGATLASMMAKFLQDILESFPPDMELNKAKMSLVEMILNLVPVSTFELSLIILVGKPTCIMNKKYLISCIFSSFQQFFVKNGDH